MAVDIDHLASERFIHDDLLKQAEHGIKSLYKSWKKDKHIAPFLLTWPAEAVSAYDGRIVNDICRLELPENRNVWQKLLREAVTITKAYAILLCEQKDTEVTVLLESPHGTRSWRVPIETRGVVKALGKPSYKDNVDSVGLLWRPLQAKA